MFDSQKLSFQNFVMGYKHGVYIITKDACGACQQYKQDIEYVNNRYLYFVEAAKEQEVRLAKQLHDRLAFPITAGWKDNQLVWVRIGEQYGEDFIKIMNWLEQFGEAPLTKEELDDRIEKFNAKCILSFYIFPDDCSQEERNKIIDTAFERHELPVDIDTICPNLELTKRVNMIMSYNATANYILYNPRGSFDSFKASLLADYMNMNGKPVITRELDG